MQHNHVWTGIFSSWYACFIEKVKLKTADQSSPLIGPQPREDPEEQGLRILAKIIAHKLAKSRRNEYEQGEDDSPASGDDE
jgi:hypothetical protein